MRSSRPVLSHLLLTAALFPAAADIAVAGVLVERTVAFVNKKPVLLSDVGLTKALLQIPESDAIERTIEETLMYEEASRLTSGAPPEEEIVSALLDLDQKGGRGFGRALLRRKALAQIAISKYIDLRLRPLVRIEDAEVRRVFNEKVLNDPRPPTFSVAAPSIRAALEARSLDQKIEDWIASLRRRETVRRLAPAR